MRVTLLCCLMAAFCMHSGVLAVDVATDIFGLSENATKDLCIDLVFALDWSCSVAVVDFDRMKEFIRAIVKGMVIGPDFTQVGVIIFFGNAEIKIGVDDYDNKDDLDQAIQNMFFGCDVAANAGSSVCCKWSTDTWVALDMTRTSSRLLGKDRSVGDKRKKKVLIVVTDGVPRTGKDSDEVLTDPQAVDKTITAAIANKQKGIIILVVKIPNKSAIKIEGDLFTQVASDESDGNKYIFDIQDLKRDVAEVFGTVARFTCPAVCTEPIDMIFIMDKSISITPNNLKISRAFFKDIADAFSTNSYFGMLSFNKNPKEIFRLGRYSTQTVWDMIDQVDDTTSRYTQAHKALAFARKVEIKRFGRPGVPKLAILDWDGITWLAGMNKEWNKVYEPSRTPVRTESYYWKRKNMHIVIVGLHNHLKKRGMLEWQYVATPAVESNDVQDHIYDLQTGEPLTILDLQSVVSHMTKTICKIRGSGK